MPPSALVGVAPSGQATLAMVEEPFYECPVVNCYDILPAGDRRTSLAGGATLAVLLLTSCGHHTLLTDSQRDGLRSTYVGKSLALRQSCFVGEFYDENEYSLLSPHAAANLFDLVDTRDRPIQPELDGTVVPAGTLVKVVDFLFPSKEEMPWRMLTTPRYNPWLVVELPRGAAPARFSRYAILVLPADQRNPTDLSAATDALLGPAQEVELRLSQIAPRAKLAIKQKEWLVGMNQEELSFSLGRPLARISDQLKGQYAEISWYADGEYWFIEDKLVERQPARDLTEAREKVESQAKEPSSPEPVSVTESQELENTGND